MPGQKKINHMSTKNKIALVTGGSRGLGRNMAIALAKKGIDVVLTYHSNREAAHKVVSEIQSMGRKAFALPLDTSDIKMFEPFINSLTALLQEKTGSPNFDFLINNAGTALYGPAEQISEEQMDAIYNIHYKGVFFLTQKAMPFINSG